MKILKISISIGIKDVKFISKFQYMKFKHFT